MGKAHLFLFLYHLCSCFTIKRMQTIHFKIILVISTNIQYYYSLTHLPLYLLLFFKQYLSEHDSVNQAGENAKKKWNLTQKLQWKFYSTTPALQHSSNLMILNVLHPKLFSPNWTLVNALLKKIGKKPTYAGQEKRKRAEVKMWKVTVKGALQLFEPKIYLIILLSGLAWSLELSRTEGQEVLGI